LNAGIKPATAHTNDIFVLIVDPHPKHLEDTRQRLADAGLSVAMTVSGERALVLASERRPDVLVVADDPGAADHSGIAGAIQAMHPGAEIPVLVVSTCASEETILRCFDGGAHDVIVKPVSAALLHAKIRVLLHLREMRNTLAAQHDRLAQYQLESERDKEVARLIIDNVGASATLDQANVDYLLRPLETLNGDLMVAGRTPAGAHCFMIADFTGHGLPAAIGVLVAHGVFTAMVSRGHAIETVAAELNRKMYQVLPRDRFLAAILVEIYPDTGWTSVWNGGMPEMLLRRADGSLGPGFPSRYLPLGILEPEAFEPTTVRRELREGDALLACSDGVLETLGEGGLFGLERVPNACARRAAASSKHSSRRSRPTPPDDQRMTICPCSTSASSATSCSRSTPRPRAPRADAPRTTGVPSSNSAMTPCAAMTRCPCSARSWTTCRALDRARPRSTSF